MFGEIIHHLDPEIRKRLACVQTLATGEERKKDTIASFPLLPSNQSLRAG